VFWEILNALNWASFYAYDGRLESSTFGLPCAAEPMRRQQFGFHIEEETAVQFRSTDEDWFWGDRNGTTAVAIEMVPVRGFEPRSRG
jgi:hypothetical protein